MALIKSDKIRILLIDSEPFCSPTIRQVLSAKGYEVIVQEKHNRTIQTLRRQKIDLVLLVMATDEPDALGLLQKIRERYPIADLPVILICDLNNTSVIVQGLKLGANDYLSKPVDPNVLIARLDTHLCLNSAAQCLDKYRIQAEKLGNFSRLINETVNKADFAATLATTIPDLLHAERFSIYLLDSEKLTLNLYAEHPEKVETHAEPQTFETFYQVMDRVARNRTPLIWKQTTDTRGKDQVDLSSSELMNFISLPLIVGEHVLGIFNLANFSVNDQPEDSIEELGRIADHLALALVNHDLGQKIEKMAITDDLTRFYHRRYFFRELDREMKRTKRYGEHFSLLIGDIDDFRTINDLHGHVVGDRLLEEVAQLIRKALRESDIPCRYGGEEFALLLPNTTEDDAHMVAERIRIVIDKSTLTPSKIKVTISFGLCEFHPEESAFDFVNRCDHALYRAKREGRNRCIIG